MSAQLIEYGAGNMRSVQYALDRLQIPFRAVHAGTELRMDEPIILPGVGHFRALTQALDRSSLREPIVMALERGVPFLGICLGMQVLFESSDEAPGEAGLGWITGRVRALEGPLPVPHMGWNRLCGGGEAQDVYFAHSYFVPRGDATLAWVDYGVEVSAEVRKGSATGLQYHPEKSGRAGLERIAQWWKEAQCWPSA